MMRRARRPLHGAVVLMLCAWLVAAQCAPARQDAVSEEAGCQRDDPAGFAATVLVRSQAFGRAVASTYSEAERACWIGVPEARGKDWVQLDVRDGAAAADGPLPLVAAVPLSSLADRSYLRDRPLVLIGTGVDLRALTDSCLALRAQGFVQVRVLLGGARHWSRAPNASDMLPPQAFWRGALDGQWRIAGLGLQAHEAAELPVAPEIVLAAPSGASELAGALAEAERTLPSEAHHQWVVVAPDADAQQAALAQWQRDPPQPGARTVAWLEGGWAAYRTYRNQQLQSATHAGRALPRICGF